MAISEKAQQLLDAAKISFKKENEDFTIISSVAERAANSDTMVVKKNRVNQYLYLRFTVGRDAHDFYFGVDLAEEWNTGAINIGDLMNCNLVGVKNAAGEDRLKVSRPGDLGENLKNSAVTALKYHGQGA